MLKKFLQMVHDNFSSIERKDDLSFHWKDCFQGREASEINQQDALRRCWESVERNRPNKRNEISSDVDKNGSIFD